MPSALAQRRTTEPSAPIRTPTQEAHRLTLYVDRADRIREVVALRGAARSTLVVDRDLLTGSDPRLVAHLAADEPWRNATLVCASYLDQVRLHSCRCRAMEAADLQTAPSDASEEPDPGEHSLPACADPVDAHGATYRLDALAGRKVARELRWRRRGSQSGCEQTVSVRDAVAAIESYEPICTLTLRAVSRARCTHELSTAVLQAELNRVRCSPIVLNRGLREAVLSRIAAEGLSMSEIALRCGRVKHIVRGGETGETSWLARRLGLVAEGGKGTPTPWIHTDVLALIARRGLGISPREVELV
jgi:hypothetical protein